MNTLTLGLAVSLTAVAAQAAVTPTTTPFLPGENCTCIIDTDSAAGAFSASVQSSDDNVTWTNVATITAQGPIHLQDTSIHAYMRLNVTAAGTAGTISAYLVGGP